MNRTRVGIALGSTALLSATAVAIAPGATAASASAPALKSAAVDCSWSKPGDKDHSSYKGLRSGVYSAPVRKGPYGDCSATRWLYTDDAPMIDYHCYVTNSYGNTWTYVRVQTGTLSDYGWIYDGNLPSNGSGHGSPVHC
ncbi:SH3 domain-containing protein [Streptomyces sp. NPDC006784]|uniref:SH3 domain-containing protein n=2 Tax=unclassified Streptomyces TaxID=2593676 RepID=UPI00368D2018